MGVSRAWIARLAVMPATFVLMAAAAPSALATTRYVPKDYKTIQDAINASVDGDDVVVMPGIYRENLNVLGKSLRFLNTIYGLATIDGGDLGPCVTIDSGKPQVRFEVFRFVNGTGRFDPFSGESYGGAICQTTGDLTLNGCRITECEASRGGALYVGNGATALVTWCVIARCNRTAVPNRGGGIAVADSTLYVDDATIEDCGTIRYTSSGGGIHAVRSSLTIGDNPDYMVIANNAAGSGGGLWVEESYFHVTADFFGNVAGREGGGASVYKCQLSPILWTPTFRRCKFTYNAADRGSESEGGALLLVDSLVNLYRSEFHLNRSKRGGAVASLQGSKSKIDQCSFRGNSARMGGGIYASYSRFEASNSIIAENNCLFMPPLPKDGGGGICSVESSFDLSFCTVTRNRALVNASGIYAVGSLYGGSDLEHTIVWGNGDPGLARNIDDRGASPQMLLSQCDYEPGDDFHPGTNFQVDPWFDRFSFDYELQWRSPLVDACTGGTSLRDFDNDLRPLDGDRDGVTAPDCGAQEYR